MAGAGPAADWSFQPAVDWRADHQSNRRLAIDADDGQGMWLTLDGQLRRLSESSQWTLHPQFRLQRFVQESQLNSSDGSLALFGSWFDARSVWTLSASAAQASTLTTEIDETGIISANAHRDSRNATLSWRRSLSPHQQLDVGLSFADIGYPGGERYGLTSYRYPSAQIGLTTRMSQYTSFSVSAFGGQLTAPLTRVESRDAGVQVGFVRAFSPHLTASLSVGLHNTRIDTLFFGERRDSGQIWKGSLAGSREHFGWQTSLERSSTASGRGVLATRDEAIVKLSRSFSSVMGGVLTMRGVRSQDLLPNLRDDSRRYYAMDAQLDRRISPQWSLGMSLGAKRARSEEQGAPSVEGWYAALAAHWIPDVHIISR